MIIDFDIQGVTRVKADPLANCRSDYSNDDGSPPDPLVGVYSGGAGTFIDETYPRRTILGPVTTEFDDLVEFFEEQKGLTLKCP